MKDEGKPFPPTCQPLLPSSSAVVSPDGEAPPKDEGVKMRKELGLLEGTSIILGIIMGSGTLIVVLLLYVSCHIHLYACF